MIRVLFLVHKYFDNMDNEFGGTTREFYSLVNAFKGDKEVKITPCDNFDIKKIKEYRKNFDVIHSENMGATMEMLRRGIHPDVIGPTAQSPGKNEKRWEEWKSLGINPQDYYKAIVVRNTNAEERINETWKNIRYIRLGVDTDELTTKHKITSGTILWAGDVCREAKNFQMFIDIMKITTLPKGFQWKVLSGYKLKDYINTLETTSLLINTSSNETFCFAMFEANARGVPSIYKKGLHNPQGHKDVREFHPNKRIQVEYTPEAYRDKILELLNKPNELEKERRYARGYVVQNASYEVMKEDFKKIYKEIYLKNQKVYKDKKINK